MSDSFFERPIINTPYEPPVRHWELDEDGQPTNSLLPTRRRSALITPVPKPQKRRRAGKDQGEMVLDAGDDLSTEEQEYNPTPIINEIRTYVEQWRNLPNPDQWQVTPETARLLQHWRHHNFQGVRPFFCQVEAVETAIWLTEVAPKMGARGKKFLDHLAGANAASNPEIFRIALKLATGAGKRIVRQWIDGGYLRCSGGTYPAQLIYQEIADMACEKIKAAITEAFADERPIKAILDAYNPQGSTRHVNFTTSRETRWQTDHRRCHVNWVICDSDWEAEFCRVAEKHPRVLTYVKNQNLGLEVPYLMAGTPRKYLPDFVVRVDDGQEEPLNLIVEIKGYRGEDAREKANTMSAYWVPGVNNLGRFGRWAFAEFTEVFAIQAEFDKLIDSFLVPEAAE